MQHLLSVIHDSDSLATAEEMAAIDVFNDRLQADGRWVFASGLGGPASATVVDDRGEETMFTGARPAGVAAPTGPHDRPAAG